jgi:hypothetical protein
MAAPVRDSAWLEWVASLMGAASRQSLTAGLPSRLFHCLLEELPLHLIPGSGLAGEKKFDSSDPLFLSPMCSILPAGEVPAELESRQDVKDGFYLESAVAWVRDAGSGFLRPFWLGVKSEASLSALGAGDPAPAGLPEALRARLAAAEILIPAGHVERRRAEWKAGVESASEVFREKNYVSVKDLLHPFHIAALRRYYRCAIRKRRIHLGDDQSARRYVAHNHPVARYFHEQLAGTVSAVVGEPVKPSYVYFASYLGGAELKRHTDREQCEFSVTLCLDRETSWPIRVGTAEGDVAVDQALGDGLFYRGTRVPHYRDRLPAGHTSTSIFFHYVPVDFSGPLD